VNDCKFGNEYYNCPVVCGYLCGWQLMVIKAMVIEKKGFVECSSVSLGLQILFSCNNKNFWR
jgi:hypothetical protein